MLSLEGKQLGNYDVIRRIRVGGMGAVYEGRQRTAFDRRVAIKVILGDYAADRDMRRRFAREARTIARLHHPHILQLIEFGDEQGILYLVMPFIEGGTLTSYLRRSLPDLSEVSAMYQQLLDAVEYAHEEGLIHRDIKSSNVLLEMRRSAAPYVYLADFGLVRTMRQGDSSPGGKQIPLDQVPGTPHYMAPEQTWGIVTPLTDIYALGVLLYQMLTGNLPYNDPDDIRVIQMHLRAPIPAPSSQDASIPVEMDEVVRVAMAKRPEDRYRSVAELRMAFLAALRGPADIEDGVVAPGGARQDQVDMPDMMGLPVPPPVHVSPRRSQALRPPEVPEPIIIPRHLGAETPLPVMGEVREWEHPRVTDSVRNKLRVTEDPPAHKRRKHRFFPVLAALVFVPLLLISLLLVPRVFAITLFPVGFPLLGDSPVAKIYVTARTQSLQNKYLLTASAQVKAPDLVAHKIPDRVVQQGVSANFTVNTSGSKTTDGVAAQGSVEFTNNTNSSILVNQGLVLVDVNNQRFVITQTITVPARQNGQPSKQIAGAIAVVAGVAGNIPAGTLSGICCNNTLVYKNIVAFSGGVDPQVIHTVLQADLDAVQNAQQDKLKQQVLQKLQGQVGTDEVMAGSPDYAVTTTSNIAVGEQSDQVQVTVAVTGKAALYNRVVAAQTAIQLLNKEAAQSLDKAYQVLDKPGLTVQPQVAQVKNGDIYLNVSVHGTWVYTFTPQEMDHWLQPIKGATTEAAQAYLKSQPGIASVDIRLPLGTSQLPIVTDDIQIIVTRTGATG